MLLKKENHERNHPSEKIKEIRNWSVLSLEFTVASSGFAALQSKSNGKRKQRTFPDAIKEIDDNLEKAWESIQILEALLKNPENNQEKALAEQLKKSKAEYFAMKESLEQDKASIKSLKKRNAVIEQKQKKKSS